MSEADDVVKYITEGHADVFAGSRGFNETDIKRIAEAMAKSTQLRLIDLNFNTITDTGAVALAEAVEKSTSLLTISLKGNDITDRGVIALGKAIEKSRSLHMIDLQDNQITDIGALALVEAIEKSTSIYLVWINGDQAISLANELAVYSAIFRSRIRCNVLALLGGESMEGIPVGGFLRRDGDHAICTRVAKFLLE